MAVHEPSKRPPVKFSAGGGIFYAGGFGGGIRWGDGEVLAMPYRMGGAYLFLDIAYAAISIGYSRGGGVWETPQNINPSDMPNMSRASLNIGVFAKYPNLIKASVSSAYPDGSVNIYPTVGLDYEFATFGMLKFADKPEYVFDGSNKNGYKASALNELWIKFGTGADFRLTPKAFILAEMLYGARMADRFETDRADKDEAGGRPRLGHGLTLKAGAGFKL